MRRTLAGEDQRAAAGGGPALRLFDLAGRAADDEDARAGVRCGEPGRRVGQQGESLAGFEGSGVERRGLFGPGRDQDAGGGVRVRDRAERRSSRPGISVEISA